MNRTRFSHLALTLLLTALATSCVIYHPHNVDIPLLHEKGEMELNASLSLSAPLLGAPAANVSFSYAPLNYVGLQTAVSFSDINSFYAQAAGGGFLPLGKTVIEGYAGYGYGTSVHNINSNLKDETVRVDGHYNLAFGQVNLGWVNLVDSTLDVGLGFKGGRLYTDFEKIQLLENGETSLMDNLNSIHFLAQPQLMFRVGWPHIKFSLNIAYAFLTNWPESNNYFNYDRFSVGVGMHFDF